MTAKASPKKRVYRVTEFAVQAKFGDEWHFMIGGDLENPEVYYELDDAREAAAAWDPDSTQVVTRTRQVIETNWEVVPT